MGMFFPEGLLLNFDLDVSKTRFAIVMTGAGPGRCAVAMGFDTAGTPRAFRRGRE
jgi:hypothetical protein